MIERVQRKLSRKTVPQRTFKDPSIPNDRIRSSGMDLDRQMASRAAASQSCNCNRDSRNEIHTFLLRSTRSLPLIASTSECHHLRACSVLNTDVLYPRYLSSDYNIIVVEECRILADEVSWLLGHIVPCDRLVQLP